MTVVLIILAQLSGVYLRYLPFSRELSSGEKTLLAKRFLLWLAADFAITSFVLTDGLTYRAFKFLMLTCWLPYVVISMTVIRNKVPQHFFVFGMQGLWCFFLHSSGASVVALLHGQMSEEFMPLQLTIYLLLFVALFPVERHFFVNLLPSPRLFEDPSLRWCISLLPVAIFVGTTIPIIDVTFLPTWRERFSRAIVPIFFFLMYSSLSSATRRLEEMQTNEQKNFVLRRQTESLAEQNKLMRASQREAEAMERKLSENYAAIEKLLVAGKRREAMEFVGRQTKLLDSTAVKVFCRSPLINAAVSLYSRRAEDLGIKFSCKIDLPVKLSTDESDLAVVLSNLLENAIKASKKNPAEREISLVMRNLGDQYILEVTNRFDLPIKVGQNGLPYTTEIGHGLGMSSLEIFAKKHDAFVDFSHEGGIVRFSVYWSD